MDKFKSAIIDGNSAFSKRHYALAEEHYKTACDRCDQLLLNWFEAKDVVAALVVSYQNLADLYFRQYRFDEALVVYCKLNQKLLHFHAHYAGDVDKQNIALSAWNRIGTEFMYLLDKMNIQCAYARAC
jgi:hypothetical protein